MQSMTAQCRYDNGTIRVQFRKCDINHSAQLRTYSAEYLILRDFNGLYFFLNSAQILACKYPFATAQRTGLSGILS
jgi:hypothetical protein